MPYTALEGALQPGHTYWGFMRLENQLGPTQPQSEWVLQFPLILTDVEVWVIMEDGRYQYGKSGFFTPLYERSFLPTFKVNIVKFSLPPEEEVNVFFRVRSDRRGSVPELLPTLQHADTYAQALTEKKQKQAFYIGIILMMLIYNFVLFFYARDRAGAYIYYSLYLLGIIVFSSYNSGDLADWLLGPIMAGHPDYVQYVKLVTYLTLIAYVAFLQYFLDLGQLLPFWNRVFKVFSLMALPALCVDAWLMYTSNFNYDVADKVTVGYALIFILLSTVFVYPLFKSHDQRGYYIGAGIVADDGIGIAAEHLPRIFERFYQVEREATSYDESTGIGLALVRKLVQLLGGTITAESELGVGTAFHVLLPVTQRAERWDRGVLPADVDLPEKSTALDAVRKGLPDSPLVLIMEDNADVVTYLQTVLPETYGLLVARDGLEGIRMALQHIPDLIISDVRMPGKNGFEVCEKLKNDERTSHIPIMLLTAKDEETGKLQGWESGADAYMSKPFPREEFLVLVEKLLESRRRLEAYYRRDQEPESGEPELPSAERRFLDKLEQIVIQHMDDEQFSVSDLGLEARLNHNQLYRKVKALTGKTPSLFIRAIRLGRAKKLLTTTSMNVSEVAFAVGFKDPSYFSKVFQLEFGTNPSELRS